MSDMDVEDRQHRWEVTPHPYSSDYDMFVTDYDQDALRAVEAAAEAAWDTAVVGETRTVTIKYNGPDSATGGPVPPTPSELEKQSGE